MTKDREIHLERVQAIFKNRLDKKYRAGSKQHKEKLWEKADLLDEAIDEVIDLAVYLISEQDRRRSDKT
jgi:hypothetical protein